MYESNLINSYHTYITEGQFIFEVFAIVEVVTYLATPKPPVSMTYGNVRFFSIYSQSHYGPTEQDLKH